VARTLHLQAQGIPELSSPSKLFMVFVPTNEAWNATLSGAHPPLLSQQPHRRGRFAEPARRALSKLPSAVLLRACTGLRVSVSDLKKDPQLLKEIMLSHVVPARALKSALWTKQLALPTLSGSDLQARPAATCSP
jgi:uncharacterized surface protein with fasciclin (FAS1) repeats